jgi:Tol biopolymer transport system component
VFVRYLADALELQVLNLETGTVTALTSSGAVNLEPRWSPDGNSLFYVSIPEVPYGSGGIWQVSLLGDTEPRLIRNEETSWNASPDVAPDGRRIAYSSYLGRLAERLLCRILSSRQCQSEPNYLSAD